MQLALSPYLTHRRRGDPIVAREADGVVRDIRLRSANVPLLPEQQMRLEEQHPPQPLGERVFPKIAGGENGTRLLLGSARRVRSGFSSRRIQPQTG